MPTWGEILSRINKQSAGGKPPDFDSLRREFIFKASEHSGRSVIVYATRFMQPGGNADPQDVMIIDEDLHGFMEVIHGLQNEKLDLILHSPGGSPDTAEALILYLRSKFSHIRVIVPQLAMSAATMMACAADEIIMGKHSFLGPTDPQLLLRTALGPRMVPAQAILDQFEKAVKEIKDQSKLAAYLPMLGQYGPDLLQQCANACEFSEQLVRGWLEAYMFKGQPDAGDRASSIATWISRV